MEHLSSRDRARALIALVTAVTLFASAFVAIRAILAADVFSPVHIVGGRMFVAAALLGVFAIARGGLRVPKGRDWIAFIALGAIGQTLYQVFLTVGERTVDAGTAALLVSCSPIVASVLAVLLLGERLTWQGWLGTAVAFVGASIVAVSAGVSLEAGSGVMLVLVATLLWAGYQIVQKTVAAGYGAFELTAWPSWIAAAAMLPWAGGLAGEVAAAPLSANLAILWLGAASSVAGFLAWSYAIRRLPVVVSSNALFAVPVAAFVIGWAVLGETPHPLALLGGLVTLSGVTLMQLRGRVVEDRLAMSRAGEVAAEA